MSSRIAKSGIKRVSFMPMTMDSQYSAEVLKAGAPRFGNILHYMDRASDGFTHRFVVDGDEVFFSSLFSPEPPQPESALPRTASKRRRR